MGKNRFTVRLSYFFQYTLGGANMLEKVEVRVVFIYIYEGE